MKSPCTVRAVSTAWPSPFSSRTTVMSSDADRPALVDQLVALQKSIVLAVAAGRRQRPVFVDAIDLEVGRRCDRLIDRRG